jgi:hypothetical protein
MGLSSAIVEEMDERPTLMKHKKIRNWTAVAAFQRSGAGKHHNRKRDVAKGHSRKAKHKNKRDW